MLYEIYRSQGYLESEIAPLILNKNLYGLEIDDRAAQLAGFALMMKARMYDKDLFNKKISLNLCAIQETREECTLNRGKYPQLCRLWDFFIDAKNYGSILKVEGFDFERLGDEVEALKKDGTLDFVYVGPKLDELIKQAKLMGRKYHCVVTNPPYMGSGNMNSKLNQFVTKEYPDSKSDLMTCFMEKGFEFLSDDGFLAMINIPSWMFLSSFKKLREKILINHTIYSLLHNGRGIFGSDFGSVAFTINKKECQNFYGVYRRLFIKQGAVDSIQQKDTWFLDKHFGFFLTNQNDFSKIPGSPIAYWMSNKVKNIFENNIQLKEIADIKNGLSTGDNNRFIKSWQEVGFENIGFEIKNNIEAKEKLLKWYPCNKGGDFKKWYGNNNYLVNWQNDGYEIRNFYDNKHKLRSRPQNIAYYFLEHITYTYISSSSFGARISYYGFIPTNAGNGIFIRDKKNMKYILSLLLNKITYEILMMINPTMKFGSCP